MGCGVKDRSMLFGGVGLVGAGLLLFVPALGFWQSPLQSAGPSPVGATSRPQPQLATTPRPASTPIPPAQAQLAGGQLREFQLTMGRIKWEIAPGKIMDPHAYNGQVPGPELRVTEGDTVRVTVTNNLTESTTVHWHGVEVPTGMDGAPKLSQDPIAPGGTFTYQFLATPAGTRWYHSHFDET